MCAAGFPLSPTPIQALLYEALVHVALHAGARVAQVRLKARPRRQRVARIIVMLAGRVSDWGERRQRRARGTDVSGLRPAIKVVGHKGRAALPEARLRALGRPVQLRVHERRRGRHLLRADDLALAGRHRGLELARPLRVRALHSLCDCALQVERLDRGVRRCGMVRHHDATQPLRAKVRRVDLGEEVVVAVAAVRALRQLVGGGDGDRGDLRRGRGDEVAASGRDVDDVEDGTDLELDLSACTSPPCQCR